MYVDGPFCSYSVAHSSTRLSDPILENRLRPKNKAASNSTLHDEENPNHKVDDPSFMPRSITGGKNYTKKRKPSISTNSCCLADRRHISIRQQSDQILALVGESIAASPTTVYRRREEARSMNQSFCSCITTAGKSMGWIGMRLLYNFTAKTSAKKWIM